MSLSALIQRLRPSGTLPSWWGGRSHKMFTLIVFVLLSSVDNAAIAIFPPLYGVISRDLAVTEAALGFVTALRILTTALSAAFWGFRADRGQRKRLLFYGTLTWSFAIFFSGTAQSYTQLLTSQLIAAVGLGAIGSVGFSLASDFIPPQRRGLILSLWGVAQGWGWGIGAALSSTLGAYAWPLPFWIIAVCGLSFSVLYALTYEPNRGQTEPALSNLFAQGKSYTYRVQWPDIRVLLTKPSNRWLILEGFLSAIAGGAMIWIPRLLAARVESTGYGLETATVVGSLLSLVFQAGSYFVIVAGYMGDRWQARDTRGRAFLGVISNWGTVPFHIAFFMLPLRDLEIPEGDGLVAITLSALTIIFSNGWVAGAFMLALVATVFVVLDSPNRAALFNDVNLPEHRGTIIGMAAIASGLGLAIGNSMTGVSITFLATHFPVPWNYAIGLSIFQLFLLPAGLCYYQLTKVSPIDIQTVHDTLAQRAASSQDEASPNLNT